MATEKPRLTVAIEDHDYEWLEDESDRAGISKGGVLRQALKLYRATGGLLGPTRLEMSGRQIYVEESNEESIADSGQCEGTTQ